MIKNAKKVADEVCADELRNAARHVTADRLRIVERVLEMSNEYPDGDAAADIAMRIEKEILEAGK